MRPIDYPLPSRLWVVRLAEFLAARVKRQVDEWSPTAKAGPGDQIMRSIDSISSNISEGYARVHVKERLHFFSFARASVEETIGHLRKACDRGLITRLEAYTMNRLLMKVNRGIENLAKTQTPRQPICARQ